MKIRLPYLIPGIVLFLIGLFWALQGARIVNQGFMAGQTMWLVIGIVVAIVGLGLAYLGVMPRARRT